MLAFSEEVIEGIYWKILFPFLFPFLISLKRRGPQKGNVRQKRHLCKLKNYASLEDQVLKTSVD